MQDRWFRKKVVTPAKAGVQISFNCFKCLDSGFRRNDREYCFLTFYEVIKIHDLYFCRRVEDRGLTG